MASNDAPNLAGLGGEGLENITSGMTGATEAGLGLVSSLTNISSLLEAIAKNPLLSIGTFRTIDHYLDKFLVTRLKDAGTYTKQLDMEIQKTTRDMAVWTTAMSGVASGLYSIGNAQAQLLKSTREVSRFATMENLPGGAGSLPGAAANLKYLEANIGMKYTSEFARNYVSQYTQLFSQLQKGTNVKAIQDIVGLYSYQSGLNVAGIASNLLSNNRGLGLTGIGAIQAVIQPMMQQMTSRFAYGSVDQVMNSFLQMFQKQIGLTGGDVNTAYQQSLTLMKGLGKDFGLDQLQQLQNLYSGPGKTQEMIRRAALLPGITFEQLQKAQGGAGGLLNIAALMQQGIRGLITQNAPQLRGTNLQQSLQGKTFGEVFPTMEGRLKFEKLSGMLGLTPDLAIALARMKDINTNIKDISDSLDNLNIGAEKFVKTVSSNKTTQAMEDAQNRATSLVDIISNLFLKGRTKTGEIAESLGVEPSVFEGAGASLLIGTFLWGLLRKGGIMRKAGKAPGMLGGAALPVIGAMDIMREAHEGGNMGQGLMNVATDVAGYSLMNKIFRGGAATAGTTTTKSILGRTLGNTATRTGASWLSKLSPFLRTAGPAAVVGGLLLGGDQDVTPFVRERMRADEMFEDWGHTGLGQPGQMDKILRMGEEVRERKGKDPFIDHLQDVFRNENEKMRVNKIEEGGEKDFGTLNIVVTTPNGEVLAADQMERAETKRIMIDLKGVLA